MTESPYRSLPAVDSLADSIGTSLPRAMTVAAARTAIEMARQDIESEGVADADSIARRLVRGLERSRGIPVVNATGVLLHTNLGRAIWSERAVEAARSAASSFTNVELDLETGQRGGRGNSVIPLLRELTGAESALVVNNNAAALLLALAATSSGRSVPVARGEMIEIGGSYRLPDVMEVSGANLVAIGTTNRTRAGDYVTALQVHDCGAILKVHPSNYAVVGFQSEASVEELAGLAPNDTPLLYDLGSGLLDSDANWVPDWLRNEPAVRQSLAAGADAVMFSGDKLIGGPQAGIIAGAADLIDSMRAHPLARALRVDGSTTAALAATLDAYLEGTVSEIPFWRHALTSTEALADRSERLAAEIGGTVEPGVSAVGAGSAPGIEIPSSVVRVSNGHHLFLPLLDAERPILTRRDAGDLIFDLRAVDVADDTTIAEAVSQCR